MTFPNFTVGTKHSSITLVLMLTGYADAGQGTSMGYGWIIESNKDKQKTVYNSGGTIGFSYDIKQNTDNNEVVIILSNLSRDSNMFKIEQEVMDILAS